MAQASFDAYMLPRHIGLYAGVPQETPAHMVQRVCGTGIEVLAQASDATSLDRAELALCVGTESMSRNPIAAYTHRGGFRMGQVEFKDFLWEALLDPGCGCTMGDTAENLARQYQITRAEVDAFAARSFDRAMKAQAERLPRRRNRAGGHRELRGRRPEAARHPHQGRGGRRHACAAVVGRAARPRSSRPSAACRPAATPRPSSMARRRSWSAARTTRRKLGKRRWRASSPAPRSACRRRSWASARCRRSRRCSSAPACRLDEIDRIEINEAFGAQVMACARALDLDEDKLNVNGGAIAIGHPLGATGIRLTLTLARELKRAGLRYGIASACIGGGQGIALLIENPDANGSALMEIKGQAAIVTGGGSGLGAATARALAAAGAARRGARHQREGRGRSGGRHQRHRHCLRRRRCRVRRSRGQTRRRRPRPGAHPGQLRRRRPGQAHRRQGRADAARRLRARHPRST